jgi:hypothetical protein
MRALLRWLSGSRVSVKGYAVSSASPLRFGCSLPPVGRSCPGHGHRTVISSMKM